VIARVLKAQGVILGIFNELQNTSLATAQTARDPTTELRAIAKEKRSTAHLRGKFFGGSKITLSV